MISTRKSILELWHGSKVNSRPFGHNTLYFTANKGIARDYALGKVPGTYEPEGERNPTIYRCRVHAEIFSMHDSRGHAEYEKLRNAWNSEADVSEQLPKLSAPGFLVPKLGLPSYEKIPLFRKIFAVLRLPYTAMWVADPKLGPVLAVFTPEKSCQLLTAEPAAFQPVLSANMKTIISLSAPAPKLPPEVEAEYKKFQEAVRKHIKMTTVFRVDGDPDGEEIYVFTARLGKSFHFPLEAIRDLLNVLKPEEESIAITTGLHGAIIEYEYEP